MVLFPRSLISERNLEEGELKGSVGRRAFSSTVFFARGIMDIAYAFVDRLMVSGYLPLVEIYLIKPICSVLVLLVNFLCDTKDRGRCSVTLDWIQRLSVDRKRGLIPL